MMVQLWLSNYSTADMKDGIKKKNITVVFKYSLNNITCTCNYSIFLCPFNIEILHKWKFNFLCKKEE